MAIQSPPGKWIPGLPKSLWWSTGNLDTPIMLFWDGCNHGVLCTNGKQLMELRISFSRASCSTFMITRRKSTPKQWCSFHDPFGVVKWPIQLLRDLQLADQEVHGTLFWVKIVDYRWEFRVTPKTTRPLNFQCSIFTCIAYCFSLLTRFTTKNSTCPNMFRPQRIWGLKLLGQEDGSFGSGPRS